MVSAPNEVSFSYASDMCISPSGFPSVTVIIPVLNEAENIGELLDRLNDALVSSNILYKVIVIDDRSSDNTKLIAEEYAKNKNLRVWVRVKLGKQGKAFSLMEGLADEQSDFEIVAIIDGDLQYPPEDLPQMIQRLYQSKISLSKPPIGVVVGDRHPKFRRSYLIRGLLSQLFNIAIFWLFGVKTDVQSGIKVFWRSLYEPVNLNHCNSWDFDLDLIVQAAYKGFKITNMPINFEERRNGISKVVPLFVGVELILRALQLKLLISSHQFFKNSTLDKSKEVNTTEVADQHK